MEELLNKNIFSEGDLMKLSPDYTPTNTLLRLQARRAMVKDTHIHPSFKNMDSQRNSKKKLKDRVQVNKEIEKLRTNFQNMNLKNKIMLKHNPEAKKFSTLNDDSMLIDNQTDISEYYNECETVLCHNVYSNRNEDINIRHNNNNTVLNEKCNLQVSTNEHEDNVAELNNTTDLEVYNNLENIDSNGANVVQQYDYNCQLSVINTRQFSSDAQFNDLQSVLIMMAINSHTNDAIQECESSGNEPVFELNKENPNDICLVTNATEVGVNTNFLNITPLRINITDKHRKLMEKYIEKWRSFINKRKSYITEQRQENINKFFDKLDRKKNCVNEPSSEAKAKQLARDYNTYQHRYKMQKHIIALQKAKLEEQNRMIEELKYNKIIQASRQSVDAMKEEVRRTYFEIDRHLKPKIKCLTNELKIPEIEEPSLVLHCLKVPQFLQRMEKRAREREEKHALIRERRKQMEEERIRLKQQAELARAEMDKEEKIKRMKELKEKRKREKIENIRKKQHAERMRALMVMAELHHERSLMLKYGIRPLKILMEIKRDNAEKARSHYKFQLKKNVFLHWMWYTEDMWMERNYKAQNLYRTKMLKTVFDAFRKNHHEYILKKQVAEDYYDLYVTQLIFRRFCEGIRVIRKENEVKLQKAVQYYNSNLQFKVVTCWRTLPALNAIKREQEARKARWREKVLQVVPDYMPPDE